MRNDQTEIGFLVDILTGKIRACVEMRQKYYRLDKSVIDYLARLLEEAKTEAGIIRSRIAESISREQDRESRQKKEKALVAITEAEQIIGIISLDPERRLAESRDRDKLNEKLGIVRLSFTQIKVESKPDDLRSKQVQDAWKNGAAQEVLEILSLLTLLKEAVIDNYNAYYREKKVRSIGTFLRKGDEYKSQAQLESDILQHIDRLKMIFQPVLPSDLVIVHSDSPLKQPILHRGPAMICPSLDFERIGPLIEKDQRVIVPVLLCSLFSENFFEAGITHIEHRTGPHSLSIIMRQLYSVLPHLQKMIPKGDYDRIHEACKVLWTKKSAEFSRLIDYLLHDEGFGRYYSKEKMWKY